MSFGLTATLLLRLDGRAGEWTPITDLADHCAVHTQVVIGELENMVASGLVRVDRNVQTGVIHSAMPDPRFGT